MSDDALPAPPPPVFDANGYPIPLGTPALPAPTIRERHPLGFGAVTDRLAAIEAHVRHMWDNLDSLTRSHDAVKAHVSTMAASGTEVEASPAED